MHVVVVGAGPAGLGAALGLSRTGARVTVVERDPGPPPESADDAFLRPRRGAPQVRHSHALLARLRNLLRDRHPAVHATLLAAGATEIAWCDPLPATIVDRRPQPGDADLVALACRRTTFDWALERAAREAEGVEVLAGRRVGGLAVDGTYRDRPWVRGARLGPSARSPVLDADLVVVADGARSAAGRWLAEHGVDLPLEEQDTGITYLSRFYRHRTDRPVPPLPVPTVGHLGFASFGVFPGDGATFSLTVATDRRDHELRRHLLHPEAFDVAARLLPGTAAWLESAEPGSGSVVHALSGLVNRRSAFTGPDGSPALVGLVAVGDAHTTTNPLHGRGCSLALVQADLLTRAVEDHGPDLLATARAYEAASEAAVTPWYDASVAFDRAAARRGDDAAAGLAAGLLAAVRTDAVVYRAFQRVANLLDPPGRLLSDPDVASRVAAAAGSTTDEPTPTRRDLLATGAGTEG